MFRTLVPVANPFQCAASWKPRCGLNTGAQWHMLPQGYPNYKTVHRRFQQWCREETLLKVLTDLVNTLRDDGEIDESECFIDACFASAKGGGEEIGPTRRGKRVKIMAIVDRQGFAALCKYLRCQSPRSHSGAAEFRLLHDRSEAGESDRR